MAGSLIKYFLLKYINRDSLCRLKEISHLLVYTNMELVKCRECDLTGEKTLFKTDSNKKLGVQNICKLCSNIKKQKWRENNAEKIKLITQSPEYKAKNILAGENYRKRGEVEFNCSNCKTAVQTTPYNLKRRKNKTLCNHCVENQFCRTK
jgi:hypothetical protein